MILLIIILPMYFFLGYAEVETTYITATLVNTTNYFGVLCSTPASGLNCTFREKVVEEIRVSFVVYVVAMTSFIGWILFSLFGGIGLFALPVDLFLDYKYRPKPVSKAEYVSRSNNQ